MICGYPGCDDGSHEVYRLLLLQLTMLGVDRSLEGAILLMYGGSKAI